jgi:diaminopimelate epimerase
MAIPFTKMQGLGNDFVVVEEDRLPLDTNPSELSEMMCHRNYGVGSDGLVLIGAPERPDAEIRFRFFNPDGSEAEMCGNGIRCFARYVHDQGIIKRAEFKVDTAAGLLTPRVNDDNSVTVDMGEPVFAPTLIPFSDTTALPPIVDYPVTLAPDKVVPVTPVSMGNPHCVVLNTHAPDNFHIETDGPELEKHPLFPNKVNVEWVRVLDRTHLDVVVWERGAGFTLACGTGACASVVAAHLHGLVEDTVTVSLPGGNLTIFYNGGAVLMTGPAEYVFSGEFDVSQGGANVSSSSLS